MINPVRFLFLLLLAGMNVPGQLVQSQPLEGQKVLAIKGADFFLDGHRFDMWGIRVASASQSDELADHLIAQLDEYRMYGINTIDVFLQGSSGGYSDPFRDNGSTINEAHLRRIKRIIEACASRNMVAVIGIFYQRTMADTSGLRNISSAEGVINAVHTTARALRGYRNIIINVANEHNSGYYKKCPFYDFNDPQNMVDLCRQVKSIAPDMLVGAGGYHDASNIIIGRSPLVDVLLFDTFDGDAENDQHSQWHYDYFTNHGVQGKPIVNVEMFGGWTRKFMPPGVYDEAGKKKHFRDVDEAIQTRGLYVHFHSNPWCQGPSIGLPTRYDLGGMGTDTDPGIRWWFEYVRDKNQQR